MSSVSQPARNALVAASATEVMSARTSVRLINAKLHTHRAISRTPTMANALKPLAKILLFDPRPGNRKRAPQQVGRPPWSTEDKYGVGAELRPKYGFQRTSVKKT